jgi:hypothetical protein
MTTTTTPVRIIAALARFEAIRSARPKCAHCGEVIFANAAGGHTHGVAGYHAWTHCLGTGRVATPA